MSRRPAPPPDAIGADHFDGHSARARPVRMWQHGRQLRIDDGAGLRHYPLSAIEWPERRAGGARVAHLPDGGALQAHDVAAFDAFAEAARVGASWISRAQQSWPATAAAVLLLALLVAAGYRVGLPWAADRIAALVPQATAAAIDRDVLDRARDGWLRPSRLPEAQRQAIRDAFDEALRRAYDIDERPRVDLHFHASRLGANAFALPGGAIVLTDELVHQAGGEMPVLVGVLAHEAGHVRHRHGLRLLARASLLTVATTLALGDVGSVMASMPALLGQLAYSRDFERMADRESVRVLHAAGHSPAAMAGFFESRRKAGQDTAGASDRERPTVGPASLSGLLLSTHPPDDERIGFFRAAAGRPAAAPPPPGRP